MGLDDSYFRVTVRSDSDNIRLVDALKKNLNNPIE
jgi:histidinol-phosphate/aromatic aminotransferase/cobyric acid decarboxylase-like protein